MIFLKWCRRRDLNPHGRSPLPPQDSVSTRFHHFGTPLLFRLRLRLRWRLTARSRGGSLFRCRRLLCRRHTFHNGRGRSLDQEKRQAQRSQHEYDRYRGRHLVQKRGRPRASKYSLARTTKNRPHARTFTILQKDDQNESDTGKDMQHDEDECHFLKPRAF
jgi:hypothetical protein